MTTDSTGLATEAATNTAIPLRRRFIVGFGFAYFGLWLAGITPLIVTLQLKVQALAPTGGRRALLLSVLLLIGAVFGLITNPLAGRISDRTTARFGMRRPWLLVGVVLLVVGAVVAGASKTFGMLVVGWCIVEIGVNLLTSVLLAILPDRVPQARRGAVSAILGIGQAFAAVVGSILAGGISQHSVAAAFIVPTVVGIVPITIFAFGLKDRRLLKADRPPFDGRAFLTSFWVNPRKHPDFGWAWWSRFAIFMAINSVLNYQVFFLTAQIKLSLSAATALVPAGVLTQVVFTVIGSIVCGPISDRIHRRKPFVIGAALCAAAGLAVIAFAQSIPVFLIAMALTGLGQGIYFAVDLALVADVLPDKVHDAAKDLGVYNTSSLLPQSLAPALAPIFLSVGVLSLTGESGQNYTALFLVGVVFAAIAALAVLPIKAVR